MENSFYIQSDGVIVMVMRDQKGSYQTLASKSDDRGETWSTTYVINMPDSRSKQAAGNLPDGTVFLINNPGRVLNNETLPWRIPLTITLSKDGFLFTKSYLLRSGEKGDFRERKYEGKYKTLGYSYPKAYINGDYLYICYSTNKEDIDCTRVPISNISLNNNLIDT